MTLIEALKKLAEKYPEKWGYPETYQPPCLIRADDKQDALDPDDYSTEDADAVLAEHGLVMWVWVDHTDAEWWGYVQEKETGVFLANDDTMGHAIKREATEATFLAALEYILKEAQQ